MIHCRSGCPSIPLPNKVTAGDTAAWFRKRSNTEEKKVLYQEVVITGLEREMEDACLPKKYIPSVIIFNARNKIID